METKYKILTIVVLGITFVSSAFGVAYLTPGLYTDVLFHDLQDGNFAYEIKGEQGGAGSDTKSELLFTRTTTNEPLRTSIVDLTKDLRYTENILFIDWQIHSFENYVFVTWITGEQSWSDVFVAISKDYGKTFDVKNISQSKDYSHEYLAKVIDESLYFVWLDEFRTPDNRSINQIYFIKSDNFGKSFSEPLILSSPDISSYEFDLEANDEIVFVSWRQDFEDRENQNVENIFFAQIFDREKDNLLIFPGLLGSKFDFALDGDVLHGVWTSAEDDDKILYGYSEDFGITFPHSRVIFDADWQTSPYAPDPEPKIAVGEGIIIEWRMYDEQGEDTPYKISIME